MWSWWRRASSCMDPSKLLVYIIQCVELTSDSTKQGCHVPPKSGLQRSRLWKMPYYRKKYILICTALKISLPSCPFNCNSHLMVILHSYSSHSMQQIFYLYSLHAHLVFGAEVEVEFRDWSFRGSRAVAAAPWTCKTFSSSPLKERVTLREEGACKSHGILISLLMKKIWLSDSTSFLVTGGRWLLGASHGEQLRKLRGIGKWEVRRSIRAASKIYWSSSSFTILFIQTLWGGYRLQGYEKTDEFCNSILGYFAVQIHVFTIGETTQSPLQRM